MLKYVDAVIGLSEVPDEISLCISFSNCKHHCEGCHSSYLQKDIGEYLTFDKLSELILKNDGITCVCFMGGTSEEIRPYLEFIKDNFPYKTAWYTGDSRIEEDRYFLDYIDYLKLGFYMKHRGGLDSPTTNQRMYKIENITHEFQRGAN